MDFRELETEENFVISIGIDDENEYTEIDIYYVDLAISVCCSFDDTADALEWIYRKGIIAGQRRKSAYPEFV